jgi:geranylgeranyl pyrophosphate synthase
MTVICGLMLHSKLNDLLPAAAAIELLHNFSLVHDDIMDNDETRRGKPTVHVKWDLGTAVLAGDGLLGLAYRKLLATPGRSDNLLASLFTEAMLEICEGQALDKTFETAKRVSESEYLTMISKKTATLIRLACQMGGIIAQGTAKQVENLSNFGFQIGLGFQIQDDLLDILADEKKLGKKVGSDFAMNKKTIASIKLMEKMPNLHNVSIDLKTFRDHLRQFDVISDIEEKVTDHFENARRQLEIFPDGDAKQLLLDLTTEIQLREM